MDPATVGILAGRFAHPSIPPPSASSQVGSHRLLNKDRNDHTMATQLFFIFL
jgi:hypothetical protein